MKKFLMTATGKALFCAVFFVVSLGFFRGPAFAEDKFYREVWDLWTDFYDFCSSSQEIKVTYCNLQGRVLSTEGDDLMIEDYAEYNQGKDSVCVTVPGEDVNFVFFMTKGKLPGGLKIGDPISKALKPGLITGQYTAQKQDGGVTNHIWKYQHCTITLTAKDDIIANLAIISNYIDEEIPVFNWQFVNYLNAGGTTPAQSVSPAKQPAVSEPKAQLAPQVQGSKADTSTDAKVINSYPLSPGEKNVLGIQHRAAYKMYSQRSYKKAYEAFSKLADQYDCNYLSAYWAGETALKLGKKNDAKAWFDKALEINPSYKPAADARAKLK